LHTAALIDPLQDTLRDVGRTLQNMRAHGPVTGTWHATQLKSEADLIAERLIMTALHQLTPNIPIVSEEDLSSHAVDRLQPYWLVDPIDGTASYCGGFEGYVTQLALMEDAQPVLAVVFAPALQHMYFAERGCGAWVNGNRLFCTPHKTNVTLVDNYPQPKGIAKHLHHHLPCSDYLETGSIGLKICRVADGSADLFVKDVTMRDWDLAPGDLLLHEAGGVMTDLLGHRITYLGNLEQRGGLIAATSANLIQLVINVLPRS